MPSLRFGSMVHVLFCILCLVAAATAQPAENGKVASQEEIDALMTQLTSPDKATREQAQSKLVGLGDQVRQAVAGHRTLHFWTSTLHGTPAQTSSRALQPRLF